jgi:hypothetical protein
MLSLCRALYTPGRTLHILYPYYYHMGEIVMVNSKNKITVMAAHDAKTVDNNSFITTEPAHIFFWIRS